MTKRILASDCCNTRTTIKHGFYICDKCKNRCVLVRVAKLSTGVTRQMVEKEALDLIPEV